MQVVACPACGLPRAEELFDSVPCPVCGHSGSQPTTEAPSAAGFTEKPRTPGSGTPATEPADASTIGDARTGTGVLPLLLVAFAMGTATGIAAVLGWQSFPILPSTANATPNTEPQPSPTDDPAKTPVRQVAVAPMPREATPGNPPTPTPPVTPTPTPTPDPKPPVVIPNEPLPPREPVAIVPAPEVLPPNPFRPAAPPAMRIDNPEGETTPVVRPGSTLVLRGRVKVLRINGLEARAVLDCSDLEAQEIIVTGKIEGESTLWLKAPNGKVTFLQRIDGRSRVGVVAPGGTVTFANPAGQPGTGAMVEGGSTVEVKVRSVNFQGVIGGAGTRVSVTLTAGGSLGFTQMVGSSRLEYGKADPDDNDPTINLGKIAAPAVVAKMED